MPGETRSRWSLSLVDRSYLKTDMGYERIFRACIFFIRSGTLVCRRAHD